MSFIRTSRFRRFIAAILFLAIPLPAVANGFVDNVQTHQYHWDLENRLLGVDDLPDNLAWEYQYDHQDRRPLIDALSGRGS